MKQVLLRSVVAFVLLAAGSVFAFGQVSTAGTITGSVIDPASAIVAGATVVAKNNATGQELTATTSDDGTFTIPSAPTGTYTVTITATSGFKTLVLKDVVVNAGTPSNVKGQLEVGGANETVTITGAGGELLQTQTATVGQTITGRQITDLPQASRNALDLVLLLPGTQTSGRPRASTVNGLPKGALNISMDGVNIQDNVLKGSDGFFTFVQPRVDAVDEVTISTATPGAESAGEGAVQIKFTTKGGTSEFHGGLFEYHRNPALNANFFYNNRDLPEDPVDHKAPRTRQLLNQFGGKLGGPVLFPGTGINKNRDKLFFFVDYEEYRLPEAQLRTRAILSPDAQAGNFQYDRSLQAVVPANCTVISATQERCAVNVLTRAGAAGFLTTPDPTISALLSSIRSSISGTPTVATSDPNIQNVTFSNKGMQKRQFPTGRADWNITKNQHVEAIYNYQKFGSLVDFLNNADPAFPGFPNFGSQQSNRFSAVAALRSTITSRLVNEFRFGLTGGTVLFFPETSPGQFANQAGFNLGIGVAASQAANGNVIQNASTVTAVQRRNAPVKQFYETLTYVRGQHNFNFGGNYSQINAFLVSAPNGVVPAVNFSQDTTDPVNAVFSAANFPGATAGQTTAAEQLYRVLTGRVNVISHTAARNEAGTGYSLDANFIERYRQREIGTFVQDSWRFRPNLTLNLGLRYDLQFAPTAQNSALTQNTYAALFGRSGTNLSALFRPGATGGALTSFTQLPKGQHLYNTDKNNFLPSVGFAWQPDFKNGFLRRLQGNAGQTVIRGGYSIATTREGLNLSSSIVGANFGATQDASQITGVNINYDYFRNRSTFAAPVVPGAPTFPLTPDVFSFASANAFEPNLKTPYVISFTGGLQRELTKDTVFEVRYVGNRGHQLFRQVGLNEINTLENGFINEFILAQQNLNANVAAGRGTNFRYFGAGTGTSPLPIILAYFSGVPLANAGACGGTGQPTCATLYASSNFASTTFTNRLAPLAPNAPGFAQQLQNPLTTRRGNAAAAGLPENFFVVNPQLYGAPSFGNNSFLVTNGGQSWYDGLTFEVRRRLSQGLLLQGNYTFSKSESNAYASSSVAFSQPRTLRNQRLDKTWSPFDIRHAFKLNFIYELPVGKGKMFLGNANGLLNGFLGGWAINGTTRLQSGSAIQFGNVQLVGMTVKDLQKAIEIRKLPARQVFWLPDDIAQNTIKAFNVTPTGYALGAPTGRYISPASSNGCVQAYAGQCGFANLVLHGPRFLREDLSVVKRIGLGEKRNIELRADFLNAINNINFRVGDYATDNVAVGNAAVPTFSSSLFGQLNSANTAYRDTSTTNDPGGRLIQLVLRFNF
jgi:hypothetical protein